MDNSTGLLHFVLLTRSIQLFETRSVTREYVTLSYPQVTLGEVTLSSEASRGVGSPLSGGTALCPVVHRWWTEPVASGKRLTPSPPLPEATIGYSQDWGH